MASLRLFARGDAARRKLPMSAEDLLEAEVLIYLRGLGFPTDGGRLRQPRAGQQPKAGSGLRRPGAVGHPKINFGGAAAPA